MQHMGRKDEALTLLGGKRAEGQAWSTVPAVQAELWFAVASLESHNMGCAPGSCWVPPPAAVEGRRSREVFPPEQLQIRINSDGGNNCFPF